MWEILEEIKVLQNKERECVPNLRRTSPVGRDGGGHSYAVRTVGGRGARSSDVGENGR